MEQSNVEIKKYLKMAVKRRRLFIVLSLVLMSVIVWGSFLLPKQYEAASTVFIESNVISRLVSGIAISPSMGDRIKVLRYVMLSRGMISDTLKALDADVKTKGDREFEAMITEFQGRTRITMKGDDLFIVSLRDQDPKFARNYINTLVSKYVEQSMSSKKEEAYGATRFLEEQVAQGKVRLDKIEEEIIAYRRSKGIYISRNEQIVINEIKALKTDLDTMAMKKNELAATRDSIKKQLRGEEPMIAILTTGRSAKVGDTPMSSTERQIAALEDQVKQLLVRYTENYPTVINLKAEIEVLKKRKSKESASGEGGSGYSLTEDSMSAVNPAYQQLKDRMHTVEAELSGVDAKYKHISGQIGAREGELRSLPQEKKKLAELEDEHNTQKGLYDQLRTRLEQSQVSRQMEVSDKATTFRIVDPAVIPQRHATPDRVKFILMGIFMGILGGFGGVYLREFLDSSVKDVQTLKDLGLPVLAVVPKMFDEAEVQQEIKKDRWTYAVAGGYFLIICAALTHELMGLTFIDDIVLTLHIDSLVKSIPFLQKMI